MNRIEQLFNRKNSGVLSIYMTAGYPALSDTVRIIESLQKHGADMIEIGIPFSDPLADGPVIQESSQQALHNGMNTRILFEQLKGIRKHVDIPLILMGYLNPVLQYGFERFLKDSREIGIDGMIIPDLPLEEYESEYMTLCRQYDIRFSMLISPQTSEDRIHRIAALSGGFLYMVADSATTGARGSIEDRQLEYFNRINSMSLNIPRLIGFGISSRETFETACKFASGAIIGSAFIQSLKGQVDPETIVKNFMEGILER